MPFGFAPNVDVLLPSGRTNSIDTRDQAPTSCSFGFAVAVSGMAAKNNAKASFLICPPPLCGRAGDLSNEMKSVQPSNGKRLVDSALVQRGVKVRSGSKAVRLRPSKC